MSNINNKNHRRIDCRLVNDMYMDLMLSKVTDITPNTGNVVAFLDFNGQQKNRVISNVTWSESVSSNTVLKNIGFTGVDNGFISYNKDRIGNDEFLDLYKNSTFDLSTYKNNFFVTQVTGNTQMMVYPIEENDGYAALKGGFYQGFFKIDDDKYQTLPHQIENEWEFIFNLRVRNYETNEKTLNKRHPENDGIFFFIGTRAENKFWELYDNVVDLNEENVNDKQYFNDDYFDDDYVTEQISLDNTELSDDKGFPIDENGFYEIKTDNKFIIFNQTKNGFNIDTWKDEYLYVMTGKTIGNDINYFQFLNNTNEGFNKDNVNELENKNKKKYNIENDLKNNAIGFKINKDGSLTYRYFTSCGMVEETSGKNLIRYDEWTNVKIKMCRLKLTPNKKHLNGKMKIFFYINDYLKFISQELPELNLRSLNDMPNRQEGVPYNISIGGGSQGLSERIYLEYYNVTDKLLPIEKYFGGTFIGDMKDFSFILN